MSQYPYGPGGEGPSDWQERRNGADPYGQEGRWTAVSGSGARNGTRPSTLPPGYPGAGQTAPGQDRSNAQGPAGPGNTQGPVQTGAGNTQRPIQPGRQRETGNAQENREPVSARSTLRTPPPPAGPRAVPATGLTRQAQSAPVWLYVLLALIVIAAVVWGLSQVFQGGGQQYAFARADTLSSVYRGEALVVRNETVYTQDGVSRIDFKVEEGDTVERTNTVCVVYSSGFSDRELNSLNNYRRQIKAYHKSLLSAGTSRDAQMERLENNILSLALDTQKMIQHRDSDLIAQENVISSALRNRQQYMRQKYPDDQKLASLYDDENRQMQSVSAWTRQYAAPSNGIVSFYTDGYENVLNLNNYTSYTPPQVRQMLRGEKPTDTSVGRNTVPIYRLVRQDSWVMLMLAENQDWQPVEGNSYKMLIEGFENTTVNVTVESVSRSGGELLVRFVITGDMNLNSVLYMRTCSILVGDSVDSLTVPAKALYSRQGRIGVVMATEGGEYWTQVEVLSVDGDEAHIVPSNPAVLYEGVPVLVFN